MRRSFRRYGRDGLQGNPFVVLADVTIALAFIFAVHGLAAVTLSSKALEATQRLEKQDVFRDQVLATLQTIYPQSQARPGVEGQTVLLSTDGRWGKVPIAEVWTNGNFQRIILNGAFFRQGGSRLEGVGDRVFDALAEHLKTQAGELTYLFVHGIVEPRELRSRGGPVVGSQEALTLSRARADNVYALLERKRVIGPRWDPEATEWSDDKTPCVPSKFAISFGTGVDLYPRRTPVGRVDLVLFYN
jgi:hypothetical protein